MRALRLTTFLVLALSLSTSLASADSGRRAAEPEPVASLEPAKTAALWGRLTASPPAVRRATTACRPLRAVFYAGVGLAPPRDEARRTALARVPSTTSPFHRSSRTRRTFRPNQASRIRALGPNFHAMAEVHFATWTRWVASTGSTWHAAGVKAREQHGRRRLRRRARRHVGAERDDHGSPPRRRQCSARTSVSSSAACTRATARDRRRARCSIIGFGQRTGDVSVYQNTVQNWLTDTAFWTDMAAYVTDWSQEVYGDLRSHAVPGVPVSTRREYLNDYLQHKLVLASAGPPTIEPARAYLHDAYSPLANGAWPRDTAWGWTMVPADQMAAYVSAQVNALRWFSASSGQSRDHWGFAWAPTQRERARPRRLRGADRADPRSHGRGDPRLG